MGLVPCAKIQYHQNQLFSTKRAYLILEKEAQSPIKNGALGSFYALWSFIGQQ